MEEEHQHKYHEPQTPHFFKIILHDTLQNGKLSFPRSFVQKYGRNLCLNKVYLKVTSGDIWEVGLHKEEDGGMWLNNGWQEFVEFYNIKFGHFLVFGYQGNSEFHVLIFDKTTSQIKYPCRSKNNKKDNAADVDPCMLLIKSEIEESGAEMAIDHATCQINASNSIVSKNLNKNRNCSGKTSGDVDYVNGEPETAKSFRPCQSTEKSEAIIRARAFDSPNPYFQIVMRESCVSSRFTLWLPGRFIMDHIGQKEFYMKSSLPCGRFWIMKCCFIMCGNRPAARSQSGWKPFVKDNRLLVGDVCVFELIDSVKVHFKVTIFRAAVDTSFSPYPETRECTARQITPKSSCHEESSSGIQYAATNNHASNYPSFDLVINEVRLKRHDMTIKRNFLKHLKKSKEFVTLEVAGRSWQVRVCFRRHRREAMFSYGWGKFVRENFLQVGDVCVFELINKEEMVLKVSIHKGSRPAV